MVGGDAVRLNLHIDANSHALITTPGATRFYRSAGEAATQTVLAQLSSGARLEWLPLETLAYSDCIAENRLRFALAPGAEMLGWDVLGLGLPASGQPFVRGSVLQSLELTGIWREHGRIAADDLALLDGPQGLAGHRVVASIWFAAGKAIERQQRDALLDAARAVIDEREIAPFTGGSQGIAPGTPGSVLAGSTSPHANVVVLRALGHRVEPVMGLLQQVWRAWRQTAWSLPACAPRVWGT
jgi:urease accessory protein